MASDIEVKGLSGLIRALNTIQRDFEPELKDASKAVARESISMARGNARTPQARLAASTLNAGTDGDGGTIVSNWPGFAGSEFGGGMRSTTRQFPAYQGKRGYFLYPAMRANASRLNKVWDDAIYDVMKPWHNTEPR